MFKKFLLAAAVITISLFSQAALAQSSDTPKVELNGHYSLLRLRDLGVTHSGAGGTLTYNLTDNFSLEGEVNYFPEDKVDAIGFFSTGRITQGFFGVKTGIRSNTAGIYGKFRPGFMHFSRDFDGSPTGKNDFAMDMGGTIEFYPSRRTLLRLDLGDTYIRFGSSRQTSIGSIGTFNSHNFQMNIGVGVRF